MSVKFSNNATTELASSIGTSDTSITVVDGSKFPILTAGDHTYVTLDTDTASPTREIVRVTAVSGNVLTVTRGQDGTSPASFAAGTKVELRLTAALLNDVAGANPSGEPIGFPDKSQTTITFDSGIRTFSITPTGASFDVYCKGVKYTYTTVQLVTIPNTTGLHFIYFSASGVLSTQMSYFTWAEHAPTAYVYWNATTQQAIYFGDERHGITLDWQTHEYLHRTRGAAIANGFLASGYTLNNSATDAATQIAIESGTFFDEDMKIDIVSTATPTAGTYQQNLLFPAKIPVLHLQGTSWVMDAPTDFPFKQGTSRPQYNSVSGGVWSTADVGNNQHATTWILATNNLTYPVIAIIGQSATDNLGEAEAFSFADLTLIGFPSVEFRPLYKLIYKASNGYANSVNAQLVSIIDLRSISAVGSAANPATDHGNLSGLSDDDHPQYVHTSEVRTPSAAVKNSFFPSQVGQTGKFLSTDGTNTVWEPPPSGSLSFTGDVTGSGSTGSSVAMTLAASGVVAGQYTKVTVDSKGRVTAGTGVTSADVTSALGYTPYNATNPAGYTTNVGTVTSVSGTGTVSGLTLTGSVTSSGSLELGGTLTLTSGQVTTALGYTPYNATNPSGYISGNQAITVSGDASGSGATSIALTLANSGVTAGTYTKVTVDAKGRVTTGASLASGDLPTYTGTITSGQVTTALGYTPYNSTNPSGYITSSALSSYLPLSGGTLTGTLTIGADGGGANFVQRAVNGWQDVLTVWRGGSNVWNLQDSSGSAKVTSGSFFIGSNLALHAGNYNSYAPTLTGTGASGTWAINVTGNAATATSATDSTKLPLGGGVINSGGSYPLELRTTQRYALRVWNSSASGAGWWLANDSNTLVFHADSVGDRASLTSSGTFNATNLTSGGNQVLHAGNVSSYALPLSGGTISGAIRASQITAGGSTNTDANLGVQGTTHLTGTIYYGGTVGGVNSWSSLSTSSSGTHTFSASRFVFDRYGYGSQPLLTLENGTITMSQPTTFNSSITANGRDIRIFENDSFIEFYVGGDANTYYPVRFDVYAWFHFGSWSISRGYGDTAPWDPISTGAHRGGLTLTWEWSGDGAWGGNDKTIRVNQFSEQYTTMVGGMALSVNGIIVWLRGGNAYYRFHGPGGMYKGATPYYSTYTASNGATFSPRSYNSSTVASEVISRMPIRGESEHYDGNNRVLHAGNYTSYSPSLTGSGASGTWGINISGTATYATNVSNGRFDNYSGSYNNVYTWLHFHGGTGYGLYFPGSGSMTHLTPSSSSYGSVLIDGSRNGYWGTMFSTGVGSAGWMTNGNTTGYYTHGYGWKYYHESGAFYISNSTYGGGSAYVALHAGNYTSYAPSLTGSGASGTWGISITGNAATVGGLDVHSGRNDNANKIVRTDGNGYIQAGWINTTSGDSGVANRLARIYSSDDGYLRYSTLTDFKVHMGLSAKNNYSRRIDYTSDSNYWVGSFGHSGYGANETFHGGSGFFDIWSGSNYPSGTSHIQGFNALHYTTNSLGSTGGNAYGIQVAGQYNQGGLLFSRGCSGGSFSSWRRQIDDNNYTDYAVSVTYNSSLNSDSRNSRGVTRLYRRDDNSDYSVQTYWTGSHWYLAGYSGDGFHADCRVAYSDTTGTAARATRANGNFYIDDNYGNGVVGVYTSTRYQGVFFMGDSYKMSADGTSLANMYGIGWSHPNAGGAAGNLTDHGMLIINNGSFRCAISNSIVASGNITAYSDERLKRNWRDMPENFVERLAQVKVGRYERIDDGMEQVGVSAQSLQPLLPEAIQIAKDEIGTLSVSYGNAAMASAVELAKELVQLKRELAELKSKLH